MIRNDLNAAWWVALGAMGMGIAGCSSVEKVDYARAYPSLQAAGVLDVQVFRRDTTVELTNTTAKAFGKGTLWLNRRYSRPVAGIAVGESVSYTLEEFRDEYGDPFRSGSFFSGYSPERMVTCELETATSDGAAVLVGFVVVQTLPEG